MNDLNEIQTVISTAIFAARVKYPRTQAGTTWGSSFSSDQRVSDHLAMVIIKELNLAGFQIAPIPPIVMAPPSKNLGDQRIG
jgi:hypothetical protein